MIVSEIPPVAAERRAEILRLPHSPETHAALLSEMPFDDVVEVRPPEAPAEPREELRVAAWNAERGR